MKKSLMVGMIAALAASFIFIGYDNGGPDPEVAAAYRGTYTKISGDFATLKVDATTATGGGTTYTGVYTAGGGKWVDSSDSSTGTWMYIYAEGGKAGIVNVTPGPVYEIAIGATTIGTYKVSVPPTVTFTPDINVAGIDILVPDFMGIKSP
ncbi:hypothetical protein FACS189468_8230 [Spirochaetia bacterium]|nr:hypothetical protein FACS189468_8230 [Spirochaetia bacterium]